MGDVASRSFGAPEYLKLDGKLEQARVVADALYHDAYCGCHKKITDLVLTATAVSDERNKNSGGQFFPRYTVERRGTESQLPMFDDDDEFEYTDNVTDEILKRYRTLYGSDVAKDDVFFFVYGLLHSREYRERFAAELKKMLPRIPELQDPADFLAFSTAGQELAHLHRDYEEIDKYPLAITCPADADLRVTKMRYGGKAGAWDKSTVIVNEQITVTGIPPEAQEYMLGSRSALDWVIERYQVKTDKASGIVNDPNNWGTEHDEPEYILDLLRRVTTVSVETVQSVKGLPPLRLRAKA